MYMCIYSHLSIDNNTRAHSTFKGAVCWYCFDEKPFNLTACFIIKCDTKCYDYAHQNGRPLALIAVLVYNNV